jgi:guanine deaminase
MYNPRRSVMTDRHLPFMALAVREARNGIRRGDGGPFGACIVRRGNVVALAHNRVLSTRNPTMHAEICAISLASRRLGTHVLKGCQVYSTTEPCPMCFSAIHWAQIDVIYFGTTVEEVRRLGFNELTISNRTLKRLGKSPVRLVGGVARKDCLQLLADWSVLPNRRPY